MKAVICNKNNLLYFVEKRKETKIQRVRLVLLRSFVRKFFGVLSRSLIYVTFKIWFTSSLEHHFLFCWLVFICCFCSSTSCSVHAHFDLWVLYFHKFQTVSKRFTTHRVYGNLLSRIRKCALHCLTDRSLCRWMWFPRCDCNLWCNDGKVLRSTMLFWPLYFKLIWSFSQKVDVSKLSKSICS